MNSLRLLPRRIFPFVARDFRLFVSYRMQFFLRILSVLTIVTTLFFISKIFAGFTDPKFSQWRDPLANWLTGLAVLNYFMTGFSSLANSIRQEQMQGTLESVLLTPINLPTVIVASSAWDFLETTFFSFLYLFFGWVFFNVQFKGSFLLALLFLLLTTVVLGCLGISWEGGQPSSPESFSQHNCYVNMLVQNLVAFPRSCRLHTVSTEFDRY